MIRKIEVDAAIDDMNDFIVFMEELSIEVVVVDECNSITNWPTVRLIGDEDKLTEYLIENDWEDLVGEWL
ncbi:MAG: hypothetical protein PQJ61_12275 [Spirochaetales bacterium]|uniref:Uncharacterized protein n=1 Tax=Candidatus Thalassospirochaeta sargassi TaxID=3119039 RepID=A0AAJ1IGJ2_9SPIO|nr:hypothetical protein [Spirochaetales bacterium]